MTKGQYNLEQVYAYGTGLSYQNVTPPHHCHQIAAWSMCFLVGLTVGIMAFLFNWGIAGLSFLKFSVTSKFITPGGGFMVPFLVFLGFSGLYGLVAGLCGTYISPEAAGR